MLSASRDHNHVTCHLSLGTFQAAAESIAAATTAVGIQPTLVTVWIILRVVCLSVCLSVCDVGVL